MTPTPEDIEAARFAAHDITDDDCNLRGHGLGWATNRLAVHFMMYRQAIVSGSVPDGSASYKAIVGENT